MAGHELSPRRIQLPDLLLLVSREGSRTSRAAHFKSSAAMAGRGAAGAAWFLPFLNSMRILKLQDRNAGRALAAPCCSAEQSSVNNPQPPEGGREGRFCFCLTRVSCHSPIIISKTWVLRTRYKSKSSPKWTCAKPVDLSGVCCGRAGF